MTLERQWRGLLGIGAVTLSLAVVDGFVGRVYEATFIATLTVVGMLIATWARWNWRRRPRPFDKYNGTLNGRST